MLPELTYIMAFTVIVMVMLSRFLWSNQTYHRPAQKVF